MKIDKKEMDEFHKKRAKFNRELAEISPQMEHQLNISKEEVLDDLETALRELQYMMEGEECSLFSTIYTDMNSVPMNVKSCLFWVQLNVKEAFIRLGGNLEEL